MGSFRGTALAIVLTGAAALEAPAQDPTVTASFGAGGQVSVDDPVWLELSQPLAAAGGRIAVLVGRTDYTELFEDDGRALYFRPDLVRLPLGSTELAVYAVSPDGEWSEIARFDLEVRQGLPFERATVTPTFDALLNAQLSEGHEPEENAPPRETFQDLTVQAAVETDHARGDFAFRSQVKVVGATYSQQALRFSELGEDAAAVDLAGYDLDLSKGDLRVRVGDLSVGRHRHLASSFAGRGANLGLRMGERVDLTVGALSGTRIVGWANPIGLATPEHRILSGTLGVELDADRPGGARLEASFLDGSVLPLANYNQGLVNDAEESEGIGLRLQISDPRERLRLEGSYARSSFRNPEDPTLAQGSPLVPAEETTADARYARAEVDLLSGVPLGATRDATLTLSAEHERVAPLYRSVGQAAVQGDQLRNTFAAALALGEVSLLATHNRVEDNLDDIPSILKTLTRTTALDVSVPLASLAAGDAGPSAFVPSLSYSFGRLHQFGDSVPENSGFNESHVPDQVSVTHDASASWDGERTSLVYSFSFSSQDNRQPGRENADFENRIHNLSFTFFEGDSLDLGLELSRERAESIAFEQQDGLDRVGLSANWRHGGGFGVRAFLATTSSASETRADGELTDGRDTELDLQLSWRFFLRSDQRKPAMTAYLRIARQRSLLQDLIFGFDEDLSAWQLAGGLTLSAF